MRRRSFESRKGNIKCFTISSADLMAGRSDPSWGLGCSCLQRVAHSLQGGLFSLSSTSFRSGSSASASMAPNTSSLEIS